MGSRTLLVGVALGALAAGAVTPASADVVNTAPIRTITNVTDGGYVYGVDVDDAGYTYVLDYSSDSIRVFAPGASGDAPPVRTITGPATGLGDDARGAALELGPRGEIYTLTYGDSILVHAADADGDAAPIRRIKGAKTELDYPGDLEVADDGTVWVADYSAGVLAYAPGANGNVAPVRHITGEKTLLSSPQSVGLDGAGFVYVTDSDSNLDAARVFAPTANGNVAPVRSIIDPGLDSDSRFELDSSGRMYVADYSESTINVYAAGASGEVAPIKVIGGDKTGLDGPWPIRLLDDRTIVSGNYDGDSITFYSPVFLDPPSAPSDIRLTGKAKQALRTVSWDAPVDDGGLPLTYEVTLRRGGKTVVKSTTSELQVRWERRLVRAGKSTITVTAVNSRGRATASRTVKVAVAKPTKVRKLRVRGTSTDSTRTISWKKPAWDGGAKVKRYKVVVKTGKRTVLKRTVTKRKLQVAASAVGDGKHKVVVRAMNSKRSGAKAKAGFRVA